MSQGKTSQQRTAFDVLAKRLADRHPGHPLPTPSAGTIVVVPSLTFPIVELRKIVGIQHYEERLLFLLLLLADPGRRLLYVSSAPIHPAVIDYYLGFLPDPEGARARLELVALGDVTPSALAAKLVDRPEVLDRLAGLIADPEDALLLTFNVTRHEREVAERLGVSVFGPAPELTPLGSKTGSRRVGRAAGVDVLDGSEDLWSMDEVERAVERLRRVRPGIDAVVVKLNNGFSGQGNAIVELGPSDSQDGSGGRSAWRTTFCAAEESWPSFAAKIGAEGGVVERLVRTAGIASPSAQVSIAPGGDIRVVSTHDQILGGPSQQVYLGCRFPARAEYRARIQQDAEAVARVLVARGVVGNFGIDFFALDDGQRTRVSLCEINLRMGGTTHPYWMVRLATGAKWDPAAGQLAVDGRRLFYTATDNLKSARLVGSDPGKVIEAIASRGLALEPGGDAGVALHLLGTLHDHGKMGMTCVAGSAEEADELDREARALLGV
jgi:PGM1 C-terminal domain/ATP-grasp domain